MAGLNPFFSKIINTMVEGVGRFSPNFIEGSTWSAMGTRRAGLGTTIRALNRISTKSAGKWWDKEAPSQLRSAWEGLVTLRPELSGTKLGPGGFPSLSLGEYFSGMSTPLKMKWLLSGGKEEMKSQFMNSRTASFRRWGLLGGGGLLAAPMVSGAIFGDDSAITGLASTARGVGVSGAIGIGLSAIRGRGGQIASNAWLGLSGFNMLRGAGYSPLSTLRGW